MADGSESLGGFFGSLGKELEQIRNIDAYANAFATLGTKATELNSIFGQNRKRIEEMQYAIADAIPGITRLGGNIGDVTKTIGDVALGARRNVIANTESVEKLYAASKILATDAQTLTKTFSDIGFTFDKIPKQLETSISYIQSIGGNAKQVMGDVLDNTDKLNRYQFEGGVQGLTKMAAQASMLKFDMYNTFQLAEKVLSPDRAVEVASAFQRLGVSVGNLVDPFQLMNQSINDPQGLQDSLINVGKQFTEFDEAAGRFKISPEGVLRLKEIEDQTGVSSSELMKAGIAAAELDKRLSSISPQIKFAKEEDKQYLANIASMKDGEYVVNLKDDRGQEYQKRLVDVTQTEMNQLIEDQKDAQKPIEEIARDQLRLDEIMMNDIRAIKDKLLYGIASTTAAVRAGEGVRRTTEAVTGTLSSTGKGYFDVQDVRGQANQFYNSLEELFKTKSTAELPKAINEFLEKSGKQFDQLDKSFFSSMKNYAKEVTDKMGSETAGEGFLKKAMGELTGFVESVEKEKLGSQPLGKFFIEGQQSIAGQIQKSVTPDGQPNTSKIDFGGGITIDLKLPPEYSKIDAKELQEILRRTFQTQEFQNTIHGIVNSRSTNLKSKPQN
jgi:hypothetical protein